MIRCVKIYAVDLADAVLIQRHFLFQLLTQTVVRLLIQQVFLLIALKAFAVLHIQAPSYVILALYNRNLKANLEPGLYCKIIYDCSNNFLRR